MFDDVRICSTRLDQRTAKRFEELAILGMASPVLGYLARASRDNVLMARAAALGVIGRPKTVSMVSFFKNEPAIVVRAKWLQHCPHSIVSKPAPVQSSRWSGCQNRSAPRVGRRPGYSPLTNALSPGKEKNWARPSAAALPRGMNSPAGFS